MKRPYITVTLQVSGYDALFMDFMHEHVRRLLRDYHGKMVYGESHIAYQDHAPMAPDAQLEADEEPEEPDPEGLAWLPEVLEQIRKAKSEG